MNAGLEAPAAKPPPPGRKTGPPSVGPGPRPGFRWTRELIVYAIDLWHREHLRLPTTDEWDRAGANHPARVTVIRRFGSWNEAMAAAGFQPRQPGQRRTPSVRERCPVTGRFVAGA